MAANRIGAANSCCRRSIDWASASREVRARALLAGAERRGVSFLFGEPFFAQGGGDHHIRLSLTPVPREAIEDGIARIGAVVRG